MWSICITYFSSWHHLHIYLDSIIAYLSSYLYVEYLYYIRIFITSFSFTIEVLESSLFQLYKYPMSDDDTRFLFRLCKVKQLC